MLFSLLFVLSLAAHAGGQVAAGPELWTVQTVALRDFREAQSAMTDLRTSGFDAFTEFAMDNGLQFVRVRVGCYTTRFAAEAMADALRGNVTATAVVAEASPDALLAGCVNLDVGFLKPVLWDEVKHPLQAPAFRVVVSGIEAHVAHNGLRWMVLQEGEDVPLVGADVTAQRFSQVTVGGVRFVRNDSAGGTILCPGTLVVSVGSVAIAEQFDAIFACSLVPQGEL